MPVTVRDDFASVWFHETGGLVSYRDGLRVRKYTYSEFLRLPDLRFVFAGNVTLQAHPCSYMEGCDDNEPWQGTKSLTNRIFVNEPEGCVLGLNVQRDYDIHYEAKRVGFARASCLDRPEATR